MNPTGRRFDEWIAAAQRQSCARREPLGLHGPLLQRHARHRHRHSRSSRITFGSHIEMLEVDELSALRDECTGERDRRASPRLSASTSTCSQTAPRSELERAARTSVALDRLVEPHTISQSLAYYYKGSGVPANEDTMSSIILGTSLLTARGIPVAGEYEVKNAHRHEDHGLPSAPAAPSPSTTPWTSRDDIVLMGHDGPGHIAIAEGKTKVRPLDVYHGKVGRGLSVEMSVKPWPGHTALGGRRTRARLQAARRARRARARPHRSRSATPTAATASPSARANSSSAGTSRRPRTTAPSASGISVPRSTSSLDCYKFPSIRSAELWGATAAPPLYPAAAA